MPHGCREGGFGLAAEPCFSPRDFVGFFVFMDVEGLFASQADPEQNAHSL